MLKLSIFTPIFPFTPGTRSRWASSGRYSIRTSRSWYVTFRLNFHHFDRFELDLRGDMHVWGAAFACLRLKLADIVLI